MPTHDDTLDTLRDIRDMYQHWYYHARRNRSTHATRLMYLDAWDTLGELVLALR